MAGYAKNLRKRVQNKGNKVGFCVICGDRGPLSRDHVPPKGCNNLNDVEIMALLPSENSAKVGTTSQGGTHYRTLCAECNSTRLGGHYDPALIDLSNAITTLALGAKGREIALPRTIYPFIKPQRIARAVVGHVLAGLAVEETHQGLLSSPISNSLRSYFLDGEADFPENLEIYYWLYPSRRQVLIKNVGKSLINSAGDREVVFGHIFKFLPLGFWLVFNGKNQESDLVRPLIKDKKMALDGVDQVEIDLHRVPPLGFPESPVGNEFIALNSDYAAHTRDKSNKRL